MGDLGYHNVERVRYLKNVKIVRKSCTPTHKRGQISTMVPGSVLLQIHAPPNSSRHDLLLVLKPYLSIINNIVMVFITILGLIVFGSLTTLLKYWTGYIKLIRPQELENLIVTILLHYI